MSIRDVIIKINFLEQYISIEIFRMISINPIKIYTSIILKVDTLHANREKY